MKGMESMLSGMLGIDVDELKQQAMSAANDAKQLVDHVLNELKAVKSLAEDIKTQNELIMEKLGIELPASEELLDGQRRISDDTTRAN